MNKYRQSIICTIYSDTDWTLSVATFLNTASAFNDAFSLITLTVVAEVFKDAAPVTASNSLIDATTVDLFVVVNLLIVYILLIHLSHVKYLQLLLIYLLDLYLSRVFEYLEEPC